MEKYTAPNVGKICKVEIVNAAHVDDMIIDTQQQKAWVTLQSGSAFTEINTTAETAAVEVSDENTDDGSTGLQRISLQFKVPKIQASRGLQLESWKRQALICRITDVNQNRFIVGTINSYARLVYGGVIGGKPTDENSYQVTIVAATTTGLLQEQDLV
jgi:hypothetical protein